MSKGTKPQKKRRTRLLALEPRVLFDGAMVDAAAAAAKQPGGDAATGHPPLPDALDKALPAAVEKAVPAAVEAPARAPAATNGWSSTAPSRTRRNWPPARAAA